MKLKINNTKNRTSRTKQVHIRNDFKQKKQNRTVSLFILIKKTLQGLQALQPNNNTKLIIKRNNS